MLRGEGVDAMRSSSSNAVACTSGQGCGYQLLRIYHEDKATIHTPQLQSLRDRRTACLIQEVLICSLREFLNQWAGAHMGDG